MGKESFDLYAFEDLGEEVQLTLANYEPGMGATLYYRVSEADVTRSDGPEIQGTLFLYEYPKNDEPYMNSAFTAPMVILEKNGDSIVQGPDPNFTPPKPIETVNIGDIEWNYYELERDQGDKLLRGQKGNIYYEIQTQGNFTKELIFELLNHFKEKNPDEIKELDSIK